MDNNISTWCRVYLENLLKTATYSLETYPLFTFVVMMLVHLTSLLGLGWLLLRLFAARSPEENKISSRKS